MFGAGITKKEINYWFIKIVIYTTDIGIMRVLLETSSIWIETGRNVPKKVLIIPYTSKILRKKIGFPLEAAVGPSALILKHGSPLPHVYWST